MHSSLSYVGNLQDWVKSSLLPYSLLVCVFKSKAVPFKITDVIWKMLHDLYVCNDPLRVCRYPSSHNVNE